MTNDEINRRVATLRGRTIIETQEECSAFTPGATWVSGGDYYEHTQVWAIPSQWVDLFHNEPDSMDWYQYNGIPDYCGDPTVWGALLIELAPYYPRLVCQKGNGTHWTVYLYDDTARIVGHAEADSPGLTLTLAYVAANEVKSTDIPPELRSSLISPR